MCLQVGVLNRIVGRVGLQWGSTRIESGGSRELERGVVLGLYRGSCKVGMCVSAKGVRRSGDEAVN